MSKIKQIRGLLDKARELQQVSTGDYRAFQDRYYQERNKITENHDYSPEGKTKLRQSLKKRTTIELLQVSREYRQLYDGYLKDARKQALDLIYAKTPKVDAEVLERFSRDYRELKTAVMLSNPKKGKEMLEEFLGKINEPGLVEIVKEEFAEVIQPILSGVDGMDAEKYRRELIKTFDDLKVRSMDPEALDAMRVVEYADAALKSKFFNLAVENAVGENIGADAKQYLHSPDKYFAINPDDDKPVTNTGLKTVEQIIEEEAAKTL